MVQLTEKFILSRAKSQDLGGVKTLNCWGSKLTDVSILKDIPNVEVINASVNNIASLEAFSYCHQLKELYLRRNKINSIEELTHLADLKELKFLWLSGNPFCESLSNEEYRQIVIKALPQVQKLDNNVVTSSELQMALQSTLESRDTDECATEKDIKTEAIHARGTSDAAFPCTTNLVALSRDCTKSSTSESVCVPSGVELPASAKTSDLSPASTKSSRLSIPRSKSPDLSRVSKSFNSSITSEEGVTTSVAESPTSIPTQPEDSQDPNISLEAGDPPISLSNQTASSMHRNTSSPQVFDSLEETNKLRQELGLQAISLEKYKLSVTHPYKPPKKQKKFSTKNNILKATLSLIEEMDVMSLLALQEAVREKLENYELETLHEQAEKELLSS